MNKHWQVLSIRIFVSIGLLYCTYLAGSRAVAQWYFRLPVLEGTRKALEWDPGNPMYYATLARALERSTEEANLDEIIQLYEKATQLSPHRARYWAELGGAYEISGRPEDAQSAFERAQKLFPNSPEINWQVGNFYLRQGETEKALQVFRKVLLGDRSLRGQVFSLAWRTGADPNIIRTKLLPADQRILFQYLNFVSREGKLDEAAHVWGQILANGQPLEPKLAFPYLDVLIQARRINELKSAWHVIAKRSPTLIRNKSYDSNLVTNGDLESKILDGGLGWRIRPLEGVVVSVDSLTFFDGARSLKIRFYGKHNVNYYHIYQYVPVKPNTLHRFLGYIRTKEITTDEGLQFEIYDAYDGSRLFLSTDNLVGTTNWTPQQLEFQTGPETELLVIRVRRAPSRKFDNQIEGTAWIDRISLNAAE